jgi:hypothetical protein
MDRPKVLKVARDYRSRVALMNVYGFNTTVIADALGVANRTVQSVVALKSKNSAVRAAIICRLPRPWTERNYFASPVD